VNFLFFARLLFPIAQAHQASLSLSLSLSLFRACSFLREGTRTSLPCRVDGFRSISRTRETPTPMEMARESEENCRLKRNLRFVKSYRLIRSACRVPKPNKSISRIDMRDCHIFANRKEWIYLFLRKRLHVKIFLINRFCEFIRQNHSVYFIIIFNECVLIFCYLLV